MFKLNYFQFFIVLFVGVNSFAQSLSERQKENSATPSPQQMSIERDAKIDVSQEILAFAEGLITSDSKVQKAFDKVKRKNQEDDFGYGQMQVLEWNVLSNTADNLQKEASEKIYYILVPLMDKKGEATKSAKNVFLRIRAKEEIQRAQAPTDPLNATESLGYLLTHDSLSLTYEGLVTSHLPVAFNSK